MRRPTASLNPAVSSCCISTTSLARQSQTWLSMSSVEIVPRWRWARERIDKGWRHSAWRQDSHTEFELKRPDGYRW